MHKKRIIKYFESHGFSLTQIAGIILDVNEYKKFVPHCSYSKIISHVGNEIIAEICISFSVFKIYYTSQIEYFEKDDVFEIIVKEKGSHVFKHILNTWKIKKNGKKMEVDFYVEFEMKNKILNKIAGTSLSFVSEKIVNAFIKKLSHLN